MKATWLQVRFFFTRRTWRHRGSLLQTDDVSWRTSPQRHVCGRRVGPLLAVSGAASGGKVCLHRRQSAWGIVGERKWAGSVSACSNFLLGERKSPGSYFSPAQPCRPRSSLRVEKKKRWEPHKPRREASQTGGGIKRDRERQSQVS